MLSYPPPGKRLIRVEEENATDEEKEASAAWKTILKRKGLPLNTPYEYVRSWPKDDDESRCDALFVKAKKKREADTLAEFKAAFRELESDDPKTAPEQVHAFRPLPPIPKTTKSCWVLYEDCFVLNLDDRKREKKKRISVNGIVYKDPELQAKKDLLVCRSIQDRAREREAYAAKKQAAAASAVYYYY